MKTSHITTIITAALCTTALTSLTANAEEREEIIVKGEYLSIDKVNSVKTPTPIIDIPQSLSIVSNVQIKDQSFMSIGDILRYTPGLSISQGEGHRDAIIIRGNQTTADFFLDGVRDDVQYFRPLYNIEQVEILRGANALLFGRGGGGGVINRVQKKPIQGEQFVGLTASVDTFASYNFAGDVNYALTDNVALRLNAYYEELDNHRDFFDGSRYAFNPTIAWNVTSQTNIMVSYEFVDDDRVVDRGVPSVPNALGPDGPLEGFDDTFFGSADLNDTTFRGHIVRARIDHTFMDSIRGNLTVQYADYDKFYRNIYPAGADIGPIPTMITLDGYADTTDRQNLIVQGNLVSEFDTGPIGHTVLFGAEYGDQDTANSRDDNFFPSTMDDQATIPFTDPIVIPEFGFTNPVRNRESEVKFMSVYLQDQIDLTDQIKLVGGVRFDRFDIEVLDIFNGNQNFDRVDEEFSFRGGVIYKPVENASIYASYSESFLPRSGDQFLSLTLDQEALEPEFFKNYEIGVKYDIRPDLSFTAAYFWLEQDSVTTPQPSNPSNTLILDGVNISGLELQLEGSLTDWWAINAGFSYLDGEVEGGGNDGNRTRQTPETMVSIWSLFKPTQKLALGVGVTHQASMFALEDNSVELPDFTRVDAAIYYYITEDTRVQVNIENLLNTDYFPDAHNNDNISTGEPINARFTVTTQF